MRKQVIHTNLLAGVLCAPAFAQTVKNFGGAHREVRWSADLGRNERD